MYWQQQDRPHVPPTAGEGTCRVHSPGEPEAGQPTEAQAEVAQPHGKPRDKPAAPAAGQGGGVWEVPLEDQKGGRQSPHNRCQIRLPQLYYAEPVLCARRGCDARQCSKAESKALIPGFQHPGGVVLWLSDRGLDLSARSVPSL